MKLSTKLVSTVVPFVIVIVVAIIAVERYGKQTALEKADQNNIAAIHGLWNKIVSSRLEIMSRELFTVTRSKQLFEGLERHDSEQITAVMFVQYNTMKASLGLDKMLITDGDGNTLYSSDRDFRGRTRIPLVHKALKEGRIEQGLQRDDDGDLSMVYVFPMYLKSGQAIGAGVFISTLSQAMHDFKKNESSDVFILNEDGSAKYKTAPEIWNIISDAAVGLQDQHFTYVKHDGVVYRIGKFGIRLNATGDQLIYMVTAKDYTEIYNANRTGELMSIGLSMILILILIMGMFWLLRRTLTPINSIVKTINDLAQGDFTSEVKLTGSNTEEIVHTYRAVKEMQERLSQSMKHTADIANELSNSSSRMSELAAKTTVAVSKQYTETDQVVSAMNQMDSTVLEVGQNAKSAAASAQDADAAATKGKEVVHQSITAIQSLAKEVERGANVIHQLESESSNIGTVLDVIRDIAEQTNLLALNAAIEAARAGEQGRGFAVVADEVRTLASRTAESTAEIQQMIERLQAGAKNAVNVMEDGRNQAANSVEKAAEAGQVLDTIASMVATISDMNSQIVSAAEEQAAVTNEINHNVVNISDATSSITEGASEVEDAGRHMVALSNSLNELVSQFKIRN